MRPGEVYAQFTAKDGRRVELRAPRGSDLPELLKFANALVKERRTNPDLGIISLDGRVSKSGERKFLTRAVLGIRKKEVAGVVAFVGGRLVGTCEVTRWRPYDVTHTGLLGIAILEGYRGIGLGEAMVRTVLREANQMGVWLVELQVFATSSVAVHLYEKVGFRRAGLVPGKIMRRGKLIDEVQMYVDLRGTDKSTRGRRLRS